MRSNSRKCTHSKRHYKQQGISDGARGHLVCRVYQYRLEVV